MIDRSDPQGRMRAHQRDGRGVERIRYPVGVRRVPVAAVRELTPHMIRVTLRGDALRALHTYQADDHIKIVFPDDDGTQRDPIATEALALDWPRPMPTTRSYTIRRFDAAAGEIDLDVVVHDGGRASEWAQGVGIGDPTTIAGPPGAKAFPLTYAHYVFAVDATALPAAARWLEESPADLAASIVVETTDPDLRAGYPLALRPNVTVTWIDAGAGPSSLGDVVAALPVPTEDVFVFAAGEAGDIDPVRVWAAARGFDAVVTGYWRRGVAGMDD